MYKVKKTFEDPHLGQTALELEGYRRSMPILKNFIRTPVKSDSVWACVRVGYHVQFPVTFQQLELRDLYLVTKRDYNKIERDLQI